jgi:hypothetical protein
LAVLQLVRAELLIASRNARERWATGKLQMLWFFFLFFGLVFAFRIVILVARDQRVDLGIRPEDLLLLAQFTFFVKGAADSLHGLIENRYTHFLLAQPVRPSSLLVARGAASTLSHLFFISLGLLAFLLMDLASRDQIRGSVPWIGYVELLAVAAFGTICGVGTSVETHRRPARRRLSALLYTLPLSAGLVILTQSSMGEAHIAAFLVLSLVAIAVLRARGELLLEVIGVQERERSSRPVPAFPAPFGARVSRLGAALLRFEWIKYWRSRHHWVAAVTLVVLGILGYYFREAILPLVREFGFFVNSRFTPYLEVIFVFFLCYLAAMLLGAVPAMESLLGEQRTLYLFRTSPVPLRHLTFAKGWHLTPNLALLVLALPLPVGLLLQLTPARLAFSVLAAIALFALSTGLALALGTVFISSTSEEEEAGVVPLYTLLMTCLLLGGAALLGIGSVFLQQGHLAGWALLIGFVGLCFGFLRWASGWSAKRLAEFEPRGSA